VAEGTLAFRFERPPGFQFKPGQAVVLELPEPAAEGQKRRTFSLVSAPYEPRLTIATRMRDSGYKTALRALPEGALVKLIGPMGRFTFAPGERPAVFIAGGIGITPFISMLRQAVHERSKKSLVLLYSNRRPEDAAFLEELEHMEQTNPSFRLLATMTDMDRSSRSWTGETVPIGIELIERATHGLTSPVYYVVGPPGMVAAMRQALTHSGVSDEDILTEEFYGY
jgi:ferredoxin-NADP reductase